MARKKFDCRFASGSTCPGHSCNLGSTLLATPVHDVLEDTSRSTGLRTSQRGDPSCQKCLILDAFSPQIVRAATASAPPALALLNFSPANRPRDRRRRYVTGVKLSVAAAVAAAEGEGWAADSFEAAEKMGAPYKAWKDDSDRRESGRAHIFR